MHAKGGAARPAPRPRPDAGPLPPHPPSASGPRRTLPNRTTKPQLPRNGFEPRESPSTDEAGASAEPAGGLRPPLEHSRQDARPPRPTPPAPAQATPHRAGPRPERRDPAAPHPARSHGRERQRPAQDPDASRAMGKSRPARRAGQGGAGQAKPPPSQPRQQRSRSRSQPNPSRAGDFTSTIEKENPKRCTEVRPGR